MKKIIAIISVFTIIFTSSVGCTSASTTDTIIYSKLFDTALLSIGCAAGIGTAIVTTPLTAEYWEKCHNEYKLKKFEHNQGVKKLGTLEKVKLISKECMAASATCLTPLAAFTITTAAICITGLVATISISAAVEGILNSLKASAR